MVAHPHYLQSEEADLRRLKFILPIDSIVPLVSVKTAELESTGRICEIYQALSKPYNEESMSPWGGQSSFGGRSGSRYSGRSISGGKLALVAGGAWVGHKVAVLSLSIHLHCAGFSGNEGNCKVSPLHLLQVAIQGLEQVHTSTFWERFYAEHFTVFWG